MRMKSGGVALTRTAPAGFEPLFEMEKASVVQSNLGLALGLAAASGISLVLWIGLLQAARWAAETFF